VLLLYFFVAFYILLSFVGLLNIVFNRKKEILFAQWSLNAADLIRLYEDAKHKMMTLKGVKTTYDKGI
jgi:hypothetical protein